jgi:hypothetical protein
MLILMLKQLNLSQSITGCYILHKINLTCIHVLNTVAMKIFEIYNTDENIGPAPRGACNKPASQLPASWVSSCKSKGRMKRTGSRNEKIGGRTQKVAGKRIKGQKYGGPLPDYSK